MILVLDKKDMKMSMENDNEIRLEKLGEKTFYVTGLFKIGVYKVSDTEICLIESGLDRSYAKSVDTVFEKEGLNVKYIINTHYHADHSGGNAYFQEKYNCQILATRINAELMREYALCPSIIWGGNPVKNILNNYFLAEDSYADDILQNELPEGIEIGMLPGHSYEMIYVKTKDDVVFLGDAVVAKDTLMNHHLSYIYDIEKHLETLDVLEQLKAKYYVAYHDEPFTDIKEHVAFNRKNIYENIELIKEICNEPKTIEEVVREYFNRYGFRLSMYKFAVDGGMIRNYMTYLYNKGELCADNIDNFIKWHTTKKFY